MNSAKPPSTQYSPVTAPVRTILGLPRRVDSARQTKASLSVWEGEGGAIDGPAAVVPSPTAPAEQLALVLETDDVLDTIAYVEMHRQVMAKEAGYDVARDEALRKLHEALAHAQALAHGSGESSRHAANADALASEVQRVQRLVNVRSNASNTQRLGVQQVAAARDNVRRSPTGNLRVRRTMGRGSR
jgi:hypothetical protein